MAVQGLSLVDRLRRDGGGQQRVATVEQALPPLFCAAAAFRADADTTAPGVALARSLLQHLRREATGEAADEGPQVPRSRT